MIDGRETHEDCWSVVDSACGVVCIGHEIELKQYIQHCMDCLHCAFTLQLFLESVLVTTFRQEPGAWNLRGFVEGVVELCIQFLSPILGFVAWRLEACGPTRKRLSPREHREQRKKRTSGVWRMRRFRRSVNFCGLQILSLTYELERECNGYPTVSADHGCLRLGFAETERHVGMISRLPEMISTAGAASSSSSQLARNLESASRILKAPEVFESLDTTT